MIKHVIISAVIVSLFLGCRNDDIGSSHVIITHEKSGGLEQDFTWSSFEQESYGQHQRRCKNIDPQVVCRKQSEYVERSIKLHVECRWTEINKYTVEQAEEVEQFIIDCHE